MTIIILTFPCGATRPTRRKYDPKEDHQERRTRAQTSATVRHWLTQATNADDPNPCYFDVPTANNDEVGPSHVVGHTANDDEAGPNKSSLDF